MFTGRFIFCEVSEFELSIFWFLKPGLNISSITARLAASVIMVLIFLPLHEIVHLFIYKKITNENFRFRDMFLSDLFDPLGALSMVILNYGWAKSVVDWRFIDGKEKAYSAIVGPIFNIFVAVVFAIANNLTKVISSFLILNLTWIVNLFMALVDINVSIAVFNLILPLTGFDCFHVLEAILPKSYLEFYHKNYLFINLFMIIMLFYGIFDFPLMLLETIIRRGISIFSRLPFLFLKSV